MAASGLQHVWLWTCSAQRWCACTGARQAGLVCSMCGWACSAERRCACRGFATGRAGGWRAALQSSGHCNCFAQGMHLPTAALTSHRASPSWLHRAECGALPPVLPSTGRKACPLPMWSPSTWMSTTQCSPRPCRQAHLVTPELTASAQWQRQFGRLQRALDASCTCMHYSRRRRRQHFTGTSPPPASCLLPPALQTYHRYMREHLIDHVDIPPEAVHIPDGTVPLVEVPR